MLEKAVIEWVEVPNMVHTDILLPDATILAEFHRFRWFTHGLDLHIVGLLNGRVTVSDKVTQLDWFEYLALTETGTFFLRSATNRHEHQAILELEAAVEQWRTTNA